MIFEKILMYLAVAFIVWELYKAFNTRIIKKTLDDPKTSPLNKLETIIERLYLITSVVGLFTLSWKSWLLLSVLSATTLSVIYYTNNYKKQMLIYSIDCVVSIAILISIVMLTMNAT